MELGISRIVTDAVLVLPTASEPLSATAGFASGVNMAELVSTKDMIAKVTPSGRTALVPGFMAGVEAAARKRA